jgi:hypothetical protein
MEVRSGVVILSHMYDVMTIVFPEQDLAWNGEEQGILVYY